MKYILMVSYNCGCDYQKEEESHNKAYLVAHIGKKLDKEMLRWYIEDEKGKAVCFSGIHNSIVESLFGKEV